MVGWPQILKTGLPTALLSLYLGACAGGFSKDQSPTEIVTAPAAARCTLEGENYSVAVQTPISVYLPKEAAPITLTCGAQGHRPFVTTLRPRFNEKVFGNLMLGSIAGMIVDFTNGHDTKYPERVHINLEPAAFATIEDRDVWYGHYRNYISWKWQQAEAEIINHCQADGEDYDCLERQRNLATARAEEMDALERRRRGAHIDARSTAERPTPVPPAAQ